MNVELKLSVPLSKLSALAAALIATLGADGAAAALTATVTTVDTPAPAAPAATEGKKGKGKASAAPADAPAAASKPADASAQASDTAAPPPSPSTGETSQPTADTKSDDEELPVYEKMDLGPRIVAVSESGNAERIAAVKALLGTYPHSGFPDTKKAGSGRHLRREDLNDFNEKFTALEAKWKEEDEEAMG